MKTASVRCGSTLVLCAAPDLDRWRLVKLLDTGVRVLPQRDWEERERWSTGPLRHFDRSDDRAC